ncbi:MAG: acylneuraminate cytidylyltransferase family protein [Candidatus Omnitrophica bacterium]|nr:acylneuraminate cytidylyltransferase family protein [Candidatus Omnitrophota bacterium]
MSKNKKILALITARGESKSIPHKNIKPLGGKPLIAWTIEAAKRSKFLERIVVSTDDSEIAEVARKYNIEVPFLRPKHLARDNSSHVSVVLHALKWLYENESYQPDFIMVLQPTSPLRNAEDVDSAIRIIDTHNANSVVSVCLTHYHPYLINKIDKNGKLVKFIDNAPGLGSELIRRQSMPAAYFINGAIFLTRCSILLKQNILVSDSTYPYIMPEERSLQIDEPFDYYLVDLIMNDKLSKNSSDKNGGKK